MIYYLSLKICLGYCRVDKYYKRKNQTNTYNHHHKNLTELCNYCTNTTIQNIEQYYITNPPSTTHLKQIVGINFENGPDVPTKHCPQNSSNITISSSSTSGAASNIKLKKFKEIYSNFAILMILVFTGISFLD